MREILPSGRAEWRSITDDVPDYIPVEFERFAAPAVDIQPDGLVSRTFTYDNSSYTVTSSSLTTESTSSYTLNLDMNAIDQARRLLEQMTEANSAFSSTTSMDYETYSNIVDSLDISRNHIGEIVSVDEETVSQSVEEEPTIDDSDLIEPEPITKRKIVRRKKERPMFWKEKASGERTTLPALIGQFCSNLYQEGAIPDRGTPMPSSPFVKMIPLKVLNNSFGVNHRAWTGYSTDSRRRNYHRHLEAPSVEPAVLIANQNTGVSQLVNSMITTGRINNLGRDSFKMHTSNVLNSFIRDSELLDLSHCENSASSFEYTSRAFVDGESFRINARTFSASIGQLTCFLETERYSRTFTPQIMAVILPENYVYQKEYVLLHGKIDLSKVVVLVNRELDDTDFHNKNFRAYYRKHLLPILNSLKVDVWKVPVSFMQENCFHGEVTLEKTSFMEKRQELEGIYQNFRNHYAHIDLDPPIHNDDDSGDDYDEDYDDDDDDY